MTRVLVCGPRFYGELIDGKPPRQALHECRRVFDVLDAEHAKAPFSLLIHGECRVRGVMSGADRIANEWAVHHGIHCERYPVDHALDGPWPAAGPRRNRRMLNESKPDRGIGFMPPVGTKKSGTLGMVDLMERAGLNVLKMPDGP